MSGWVMCHGTCVNCGQVFAFNPNWVPSVRVNGTREPVCLDCVRRANPVRKAKGLPEIVVHPQAYEPCPEPELHTD